MSKKAIVLLFILIAAIASIVAFVLGGWRSRSMDLVLLVDTSASMVGKGTPPTPNIFSDVKQELKSFINDTKPGDTVTLLAFDADVRKILTLPIKNKTKDIGNLNAEIDALKATGQWTYMAKALEYSMQVAEDLFKKHPDHIHVAVLLSDGKNDPPPECRAAEDYDLSEKTRPYRGRPWYVYYISLGSEPDPGFQKAVGQFKKGKTIVDQGARDLRKEVKDIRDEVYKQRALKILKTIGIILGSLVLAAIIFFLLSRLKSASQEKIVQGVIEFFTAADPTRRTTVDLSEIGSREVTIGVETKHHVFIPAVGEMRGLIATIRNHSIEGVGMPQLVTNKGHLVRHRGIEVRELRLYDRDEFQIGDIQFLYRNGELSRRQG